MSWYVESNSFEEELLSYKYEILIKQGIQKCIDLINDKNKQINELKLCNSDYYNMVNTCTSKISRIRERASYEETNAESLSHDILSIIDEKEICLKPIENHTKEALEFIDRYLSLDLDEFNASSLLKKLREILTRGDN